MGSQGLSGTDRVSGQTGRDVPRRRAVVMVVMAAMAVFASSGAAAASEPIPLTPLTGLRSLEATVDIAVDGTVEGEPTAGDLTATLVSNDQRQSRIDVEGSLLGDIVAKVGGSAVSLFRPKRVGVYTVPEGTYAVVTGLFDVCVKPRDSQATDVLAQLSPEGLMTMLTGSDVARGTLVGEEMLGDMPVRHYVIDGDEFLAAAQASSDPTVREFAGSLRSASDADLWVSAEGGYPVAYRGSFGGSYAPLRFDGDLSVEIALTGLGQDAPVTLPGACDHPIST